VPVPPPNAGSSAFLRPVASEAQLRDLLTDVRVVGIMISLGPQALRGVDLLIRTASKSGIRVPVIVDVPSSPLAFRQLVQLCRAGVQLRAALSFSGDNELRETIRAVSSGVHQSAAQYLVGCVAPALPPPVAPIVVPALLIGTRKANAGTLARATMLKGRTMRHRLSALGLPTATRLLGLVSGCHVAYETEVLGRSLRDAADDAGFGSEDELRTYLTRRTGLSPSAWRHRGISDSVRALQDQIGLPATCGGLPNPPG
jgi:AraC-like DNA-binding protein